MPEARQDRTIRGPRRARACVRRSLAEAEFDDRSELLSRDERDVAGTEGQCTTCASSLSSRPALRPSPRPMHLECRLDRIPDGPERTLNPPARLVAVLRPRVLDSAHDALGALGEVPCEALGAREALLVLGGRERRRGARREERRVEVAQVLERGRAEGRDGRDVLPRETCARSKRQRDRLVLVETSKRREERRKRESEDAPPPLLAPPPAVLRVRSTCCEIELVMSRIPSRTAAASTSNCGQVREEGSSSASCVSRSLSAASTTSRTRLVTYAAAVRAGARGRGGTHLGQPPLPLVPDPLHRLPHPRLPAAHLLHALELVALAVLARACTACTRRGERLAAVGERERDAVAVGRWRREVRELDLVVVAAVLRAKQGVRLWGSRARRRRGQSAGAPGVGRRRGGGRERKERRTPACPGSRKPRSRSAAEPLQVCTSIVVSGQRASILAARP